MTFPSWRYGPKGEAQIFTDESEVPEGWQDRPFTADEPQPAQDPLDHDGDGAPGGSTALKKTDDLAAARANYKEVTGKRPFPGWDQAEIEKRLAAHILDNIDVSEF